MSGKTQPPGDPWRTQPWCPCFTILANSEPSLSPMRQVNHYAYCLLQLSHLYSCVQPQGWELGGGGARGAKDNNSILALGLSFHLCHTGREGFPCFLHWDTVRIQVTIYRAGPSSHRAPVLMMALTQSLPQGACRQGGRPKPCPPLAAGG